MPASRRSPSISGPLLVCDEPAATYERASDEHGRLAVSGATNRLRIGDKVRLIPGHCDPTVNLYDWYASARAVSSKSGRLPRKVRFIFGLLTKRQIFQP
jgi:3-hydroxy-D-aspartate aldolase